MLKTLIQFWFCFLSFLLLICFNSKGQVYKPFPTDSAQWSIFHFWNSSLESFQYKMKGDTILNGLTYHKIYHSYSLSYNSLSDSLRCFIREDSTKKIFIKYPFETYQDSSEFVLYDFNLSVGDTVTIRLIADNSFHKLKVFGIFQYFFVTGPRRAIGLDPINSPIWGIGCDNICCSWTDGIGSNINFLYTEMPSLNCDNDFYNLQCFWEKGIYEMGGSSCDNFVNGINSDNTSKQLSVNPNPVLGNIYIELNYEISSLEVFTILGQKILELPLSGQSSASIEGNQLSSGIFIFQFTTLSGIKIYKKIIKL